MGILSRIQLSGFKSIKSMDLELRSLNVMIGANGSGKSNLISYFKMLNAMVSKKGGLQNYVMKSGFAQSVLHFGPKITSVIGGILTFENDQYRFIYNHSLVYAPVDQLAFANEFIMWIGLENPGSDVKRLELGNGGKDSNLLQVTTQEGVNFRQATHLISTSQPFHFDDVTSLAGVRQHAYVANCINLEPDGGNLSAVLARLQSSNTRVFDRIISTIRLVAPYFGDFDLTPDNNYTTLNWREKDSEVLFGPHQISDGTLRAMCLITLLLLPDDQLPSMIIVDEPELGLHPYAISVIASLFQAAARRTQVLVSTQSPVFLDHFEAEDVIVVDRNNRESTFTRLDPAELETWLERYTLGEIWQKNIVRGGPH